MLCQLVLLEQVAKAQDCAFILNLAVTLPDLGSFPVMDDQKYTAVNKDGFEVDIIRRIAKENDPHPIRLSDAEDDFWVVHAKCADELMNAPAFSEVVVAENGSMARLTTLHPAVFVGFKRWMASEPGRDPLKRRRDALQADAGEWALNERLLHFLR